MPMFTLRTIGGLASKGGLSAWEDKTEIRNPWLPGFCDGDEKSILTID